MKVMLLISFHLFISIMCFPQPSIGGFIVKAPARIYSKPSSSAIEYTYLRLADPIIIMKYNIDQNMINDNNQWVYVKTYIYRPNYSKYNQTTIDGWIKRSRIGLFQDFRKVKKWRPSKFKAKYGPDYSINIFMFPNGKFSGTHTPPTQTVKIPISGFIYKYRNVFLLVSHRNEILYWMYYDSDKKLRLYLPNEPREKHPSAIQS